MKTIEQVLLLSKAEIARLTRVLDRSPLRKETHTAELDTFESLVEWIEKEGKNTSDKREVLARLAHDQWSGWMLYLFSKCEFNEDGTCTIPTESGERWQRQMNTPYAELSEEEKDSDRKEADKFLKAMIDG